MVSKLKAFSALVPVDRGAAAVLTGASFGPHPRQRLDVYRPTRAAHPLPVVLFVYGGAWDSGDRASYHFIGRALAAQGYLAVIADYRLVPDVRYPAFAEDTAAALAWAVGHAGRLGGDPRHLFLLGHSAGAYNAAMVALDGRYLAAHDLTPAMVRGVATLAGPFDFLPLDDPATIAAFAGAPDLPASQPVNLVTASAPPFLLLHGMRDTTVGPHNSRNLAEALRRHGRPHHLKLYAGLGHAEIMLAMSRPLRWRAPVLADVLAFFREPYASSRA